LRKGRGVAPGGDQIGTCKSSHRNRVECETESRDSVKKYSLRNRMRETDRGPEKEAQNKLVGKKRRGHKGQLRVRKRRRYRKQRKEANGQPYRLNKTQAPAIFQGSWQKGGAVLGGVAQNGLERCNEKTSFEKSGKKTRL